MRQEGKTSGAAEPESIEQRLEQIRARIAILAKELEWRGHRPPSRRFRFQEHAPDVALAAASALLVAGASTATRAWRRRRNRDLLGRARQVGDAVARFLRHPELVARPQPSLGRTVLAAVVAAAAAAAAGAFSRRLLAAAPNRA